MIAVFDFTESVGHYLLQVCVFVCVGWGGGIPRSTIPGDGDYVNIVLSKEVLNGNFTLNIQLEYKPEYNLKECLRVRQNQHARKSIV